ncbi:MAG: hypothetical protein GF355_10280 [Candidatus Eisenbacteria bacterium]|nr:hypothetical protein [Candidatus Eisenbacteria bacterium]
MKRGTWKSMAVLGLLLICTLTSVGEATGRVRIESTYENWRYDIPGEEESILEEYTTRLSLGYAITRALSVQVATGIVRAQWDYPRDGEAGLLELGGLTDTRARVTYRIGNSFMLRVGYNGPTGITELSTDEEFPVARALSSRILAFRSNRVGQGSNVDLGVSYAVKAGPAAIGLGAGYQSKGGYTLTESGGRLEPGDRISLAGGMDVGNTNWLWRNNFRAVLYGEESYEGAAYFEHGDRYGVQTLLMRRWPRMSVWGSVNYTTYGLARRAAVDSLGAGPELRTEEERTRGDEIYGDLGVRRILSSRLVLTLQAGLRVFPGNELDQEEARRYDFGMTTHWRLSRIFSIDLGGRYGFGELMQLFPELGNRAGSELAGFALEGALIIDF